MNFNDIRPGFLPLNSQIPPNPWNRLIIYIYKYYWILIISGLDAFGKPWVPKPVELKVARKAVQPFRQTVKVDVKNAS